MPQEINPYAIVDAGNSLPPVRFHGKLTRDEFVRAYRMSTIETSARIMGWLWVVGLTIFSFMYIGGSWAEQKSVFPAIWFVLGITYFFAIWLPLFQRVTNRFGASGRKMRRGMEDQSEQRGWIDESGFTIWSYRIAAKVQWESVTGVVYDDQIQLVNRLDQRLRTILPWRFFGSAEQFIMLSGYLRERFGPANPNDKDPAKRIAEMMGEHQLAFDFDSSCAEAWAADRWPPRAEPASVTQFVVHAERAATPWSITKYIATFLYVAAGLLLPIWASLGAWLWYELSLHGGWDFVMDNLVENLTLWVPTLLVFGYISWAMFESFNVHIDHVEGGTFYGLSERGIYHRNKFAEVWWNWNDIVDLVKAPDKTGYLTSASIEPLVLTEELFDSPSEFSQFAKLLSQYYEQYQKEAPIPAEVIEEDQ